MSGRTVSVLREPRKLHDLVHSFILLLPVSLGMLPGYPLERAMDMP